MFGGLGFGFRIEGLKFRVQGSGVRAQVRVQASGVGFYGPGRMTLPSGEPHPAAVSCRAVPGFGDELGSRNHKGSVDHREW